MLTCCLTKRNTRLQSTDSVDEKSYLTSLKGQGGTLKGGNEENSNYHPPGSGYGTNKPPVIHRDSHQRERGYIQIPLQGLSDLQPIKDRETKAWTGRHLTEITCAEFDDRSPKCCGFECNRLDKSSSRSVTRSMCRCQTEISLQFTPFSNNAYGKYEDFDWPLSVNKAVGIANDNNLNGRASTPKPVGERAKFKEAPKGHEPTSDSLEFCSQCSKVKKDSKEGKGKGILKKTIQKCCSCSKESNAPEPVDVATLYGKRVVKAEHTERPLNCWLGRFGVPHVGVIVTTREGESWLIHKSKSNGKMDTVLTHTKSMTSNWTVKETRSVSRRTVGDFVKVSGSKYNLLTDNCFDAKTRMMKLCE